MITYHELYSCTHFLLCIPRGYPSWTVLKSLARYMNSYAACTFPERWIRSSAMLLQGSVPSSIRQELLYAKTFPNYAAERKGREHIIRKSSYVLKKKHFIFVVCRFVQMSYRGAKKNVTMTTTITSSSVSLENRKTSKTSKYSLFATYCCDHHHPYSPVSYVTLSYMGTSVSFPKLGL